MTNQKNDENDHSTWSYCKCNEYLKEHGVIKTGKLEALRRRCNLYHLLVRKKLQYVLNLTKIEAIEAYRFLSLVQGLRALLNNYSVADDGYVLAIDNDDGINEAITD